MIAPNNNELISMDTICTYTIEKVKHVWVRMNYYGWSEVKEIVVPVFEFNIQDFKQ